MRGRAAPCVERSPSVNGSARAAELERHKSRLQDQRRDALQATELSLTTASRS
jgi:hypothetical protein